MPVKFNQYWTIISQKREPYGKYIVKEFIPGMNALGIHIVAGWMVLVGAYSEIFVEGMSYDLDIIEQALRKPKFNKMKNNLLEYVKDYKTKILVPTGKKDSYSVDIEENTIKFNQAWDVISTTRKEYEDFVASTYYPLLEDAHIVVAGEWEVLIGDGPQVICEGRVHDAGELIETLQSKAFRNARRKLMGLVQHYESRILTFHIHRALGYKSDDLARPHYVYDIQ